MERGLDGSLRAIRTRCTPHAAGSRVTMRAYSMAHLGDPHDRPQILERPRRCARRGRSLGDDPQGALVAGRKRPHWRLRALPNHEAAPAEHATAPRQELSPRRATDEAAEISPVI